MSVKYANCFRTTIANSGGLTAAGVSLELTSAAGMPSLGATDWTYLTLIDPDTLDKEIVKVTALSGSTCTIERAQDETTALAFDQYDTVELRVCKAMLDDLLDAATEDAEATANDAYALAEAANTNAAAAVVTANAASSTATTASATATAAQTTADAALPKAGGTVTGAVTFEAAVEFQGGATGVTDRIGDIIMRLGSTAPTGGLLCDGTEYDAVANPEYENLFDYLNALDPDAFTIDETLKTFRVPDLRGLIPIMAGTRIVEGTQRTFEEGTIDGEYEHVLTKTEMPSHNHTLSSAVLAYNDTGDVEADGGDVKYRGQAGVTTNYQGGGLAHENVPPVYPMNFFIMYA